MREFETMIAGKLIVRAAFMAALGTGLVRAQDLPLTQELTPSKVTPLDPTRDIAQPVLESSVAHAALGGVHLDGERRECERQGSVHAAGGE